MPIHALIKLGSLEDCGLITLAMSEKRGSIWFQGDPDPSKESDELLLYDCGTRLCNLGVFIEIVLRGESRPHHFGDAAVVI